jgi:cytochrome c553
MKKSFAALVTVFSMSSVNAGVVMPQGDVAAGQAMSAQCAACHGADGNSAAPNFPKLAGQNAKYIYKQLMDMKSGRRVNPMMVGLVADKTEQDFANLAVFYAQQKSGVNLADPALVGKGEKLFRGGNPQTGVAPCAGCHGPAGKGNSLAAFPKLGGQHADYVKVQLTAFRAAGRDDNTDQKRNNDSAKAGELGIMQMVAAKLSDKEIDALASYISGLH